MFDMFSDIGIFGDTLMPVMETKKKEEKKEHKSIKKETKTEYKGPVTIVFDSISQIEIKGSTAESSPIIPRAFVADSFK